MKVNVSAAFAVTLSVGILSVSGCGAAAPLNDSEIDAVHDAKGNVTLLDTPREWDFFTQMTDISISHEVEGSTHWGKFKNANDAWVAVIQRTKSHREHADKYIGYIIERRRGAGLPELVGYP